MSANTTSSIQLASRSSASIMLLVTELQPNSPLSLKIQLYRMGNSLDLSLTTMLNLLLFNPVAAASPTNQAADSK